MKNDYLDKTYWNGLIKMSLSRLFILRILNEQPLHGYEISKRISCLTKGCCAPTEGALYPVLREFEDEGYLVCEKLTVSGRQRKVYSITNKGREAYRIGIEAWQETAQVLIEAGQEITETDKE